jgi:hypothetical protein
MMEVRTSGGSVSASIAPNYGCKLESLDAHMNLFSSTK